MDISASSDAGGSIFEVDYPVIHNVKFQEGKRRGKYSVH